MNLQRSSRILATGAVALALIGGGVGAALTDHWSGSQTANISLPAQLTVSSASLGAVIDPTAKTVTFHALTVVAAESGTGQWAGLNNQLTIASTGNGLFRVTAAITGTLPSAELTKFAVTNGAVSTQLSAAPVVIASQTGPGTMTLPLFVTWAGLIPADSGGSLTVTYSIDAA